MHRLLARAAVASLPLAAYAVGPTAALVHGLPRPELVPAKVSLVRDARADRRALTRRITSPTSLVEVQVSGHALRDCDVTECWPRLRGIGTVRRALPRVRAGAQSPLESLSRVRLTDLGLPEPDLQVPFYDADGLVGYADMVWDEWRVIGECDGLVKYQSRDDLVREKAREDRLRALGYIVVRWTWEEIMRNPAAVVARIRRAIAQAMSLRRAG